MTSEEEFKCKIALPKNTADGVFKHMQNGGEFPFKLEIMGKVLKSHETIIDGKKIRVLDEIEYTGVSLVPKEDKK